MIGRISSERRDHFYIIIDVENDDLGTLLFLKDQAAIFGQITLFAVLEVLN